MYRERERQTAAKSNALKKQTLATRALAALARGYPRAHSQTFSPKLHFQKGVIKIKKLKIKTQFPRSARREANHYSAKIIKNQ